MAALAADLGLTDPRRLRPGIGETTRALLRRDPGAVHLAPDAGPDLDPVRHLCAERGVPIRPLPDPVAGLRSPYRCVGVLRPWHAG
ncbi:RNA-binding protein [Actinomycetospora sp. CA-053990]|uniref:RNA-binding protein n=1 Tax=Actinomycetospora sp. CA-053990 TaxID=3239891 RepID=UPI003D8EABF3